MENGRAYVAPRVEDLGKPGAVVKYDPEYDYKIRSQHGRRWRRGIRARVLVTRKGKQITVV